MSVRPLNLAAVILAVMLSAASSGAIAATRGTQTGGAQSTRGTTKVQPNLQQCQGPTHNCGKPPRHVSHPAGYNPNEPPPGSHGGGYPPDSNPRPR